jgi:hypothetical protein
LRAADSRSFVSSIETSGLSLRLGGAAAGAPAAAASGFSPSWISRRMSRIGTWQVFTSFAVSARQLSITPPFFSAFDEVACLPPAPIPLNVASTSPLMLFCEPSANAPSANPYTKCVAPLHPPIFASSPL